MSIMLAEDANTLKVLCSKSSNHGINVYMFVYSIHLLKEEIPFTSKDGLQVYLISYLKEGVFALFFTDEAHGNLISQLA